MKCLRIGDAEVTNQWKMLLKTAFDLFKSSTVPEGLSLQTNCEFLHKVMILSNIHSSTWDMVQRRFHIFQEILHLDTLRHSSTDTKLISLKMINYVQDLLKRENRHLLCILGETSANDVLRLFEENKTDSEVIRFFRIQMSLHHPQGDSILNKHLWTLITC